MDAARLKYRAGVCDSLCVLESASRDGHTWFAKNSDRPIGEAQRLEWHSPRRDAASVAATHVMIEPSGHPTLGVLGSRPDWMWGLEHGVNIAGVAIGNEQVYTSLDPTDSVPALTGMDLVRLGLERGGTAEEAVAVITELLVRHGQGGACVASGKAYWSSFLVVDAGEGFVVETSGNDFAVEQVVAGRAISNRLDIADFDAAHGIESPRIDASVNARRGVTRAAVSSGAHLPELRSVLRSHDGDGGWTVCMHVPGDQVTAASMIVDLSVDPPVVRVAMGSPCESVFVPLAVGMDPSPFPIWEAFSGVGPDSARPLCELEDGLEADFDAHDPDWPATAAARLREALP